MSALLDSLIDPERRDAIAANAEQLGECTAMRGYVVQIKRGKAVRLTFDVMGENSCKVAAQHQALCEPGEYITVSPRRFGFTEDELVAADLEYLASQARRERNMIAMLHEQELNELRARGGL